MKQGQHVEVVATGVKGFVVSLDDTTALVQLREGGERISCALTDLRGLRGRPVRNIPTAE